MITIDNIKHIVIAWAKTLPYKVRIHLFGSYLKGSKIPSDIDISLAFLESFSESQRTILWIDNHQYWEKYLSEKFGMRADLQLCESGKNIPMYLESSSLLICDSLELEAKHE